MNEKDIRILRRRFRRDRSNMTAIYGCYVNDSKQVVADFRQSLGIMPEEEAEQYFALLRKTLSGGLGRNLIDIRFRTAQVAGSPEHSLLMRLRDSALEDGEALQELYTKVMENVTIEGGYVIFVGCDSFDVMRKGSDDLPGESEDSFTYVVCAVCPVKPSKSALHFAPEDKTFRGGAMGRPVAAPELGFVFPAFDDGAANIYNALYYTHSVKENQDALAQSLFNVVLPRPAAEQKRCFEELLSDTLEDECSMELVQTVHASMCQRMELYKQSKLPEPLLIGREDVRDVLTECGVSQEHLDKFAEGYDEVFGQDAALHPKNVIDSRHFQVKTPQTVIQVDPTNAETVRTRVLGGVKYILIPADEAVEVNGVSIRIENTEKASV